MFSRCSSGVRLAPCKVVGLFHLFCHLPSWKGGKFSRYIQNSNVTYVWHTSFVLKTPTQWHLQLNLFASLRGIVDVSDSLLPTHFHPLVNRKLSPAPLALVHDEHKQNPKISRRRRHLYVEHYRRFPGSRSRSMAFRIWERVRKE